MNTTLPLSATRPRAIRVRSYLAYPLLLVTSAGACACTLAFGLDLGVMLALIFFGVLGLVLLLERLMPFRSDWQPTAGEVARDGAYFLQGAIVGRLGQLIVGTAAVLLAVGDNGMPLWLAAPLAVVLGDLCVYGYHRLVHANRWLWKVHGIHHVPDKVNTLNVNTAHFLGMLLFNVATLGSLLVLGFSPEAVFVATLVRAVQGTVAHANIDLRLGWLGHVVMGPEHHRLHHSVDRAQAGNYATVLTLWDRVFGTFTWAPGRRPAQVGVGEPDSFPAPRRILASAVHPFRRAAA